MGHLLLFNCSSVVPIWKIYQELYMLSLSIYIWPTRYLNQPTRVGITITTRLLAHLPLDEMAAISQMTFSNALIWMKITGDPLHSRALAHSSAPLAFSSSPPGRNGRHFTDDIFKRINLNENHGWPSTQPGTCTQQCPIVHTAVPPLFTQSCPGRTMSTAVCIYVAGLCASCPAV